MAAHILCHGETMPSSFPAPRPTARSHGMMSEYEAPVIMQQSTPYPQVENSLEVTFDEELPTFHKPVPLSVGQNFDFSDFFDPALCITPEKSSFKQTKLADLKRGSDIGTSMKSQHSQKVRFENFVEVKEMTPEGMVSAEAMAARTKPSEHLSQEPIVSGGDMFADLEPFDESESIPNKHVPNAHTVQKETPPEKLETRFAGDSHIHSNGRHSNTDDDMEIVSILASDINKLKVTKHQSKSDTHRHKKSHSSGARTKKKVDPVDLTTSLPNCIEHDLARPEFNSTLRVSKELQQVSAAELDVGAAVKQRLQNSRKTKEFVKEKVSSRVNTSGSLYSGLVSVDVTEQELIGAAERDKAAKVKTLIPGKGVKPEDSLVPPPDILDCFTPNFIKETASYTLEGIPVPKNEPTPASHSRAFDVFRHVRSWENW